MEPLDPPEALADRGKLFVGTLLLIGGMAWAFSGEMWGVFLAWLGFAILKRLGRL